MHRKGAIEMLGFIITGIVPCVKKIVGDLPKNIARQELTLAEVEEVVIYAQYSGKLLEKLGKHSRTTEGPTHFARRRLEAQTQAEGRCV